MLPIIGITDMKPLTVVISNTLHLSDAVLVLGFVSCSTVLQSDLRLSEVTLLRSPNFCTMAALLTKPATTAQKSSTYIEKFKKNLKVILKNPKIAKAENTLPTFL